MTLLTTLPWWAFAAAAVACGFGAAFAGFVGLSAGTAYGSEYHTLTVRQRWMARWLYRLALLAALFCALLALVFGGWAAQRLLG